MHWIFIALLAAAVALQHREIRRLKRGAIGVVPPVVDTDARDLENRVRQLEITDQRRVLEQLR